jgi:hypothetical protein
MLKEKLNGSPTPKNTKKNTNKKKEVSSKTEELPDMEVNFSLPLNLKLP